jgi:hypothetical protein
MHAALEVLDGRISAISAAPPAATTPEIVPLPVSTALELDDQTVRTLEDVLNPDRFTALSNLGSVQ